MPLKETEGTERRAARVVLLEITHWTIVPRLVAGALAVLVSLKSEGGEINVKKGKTKRQQKQESCEGTLHVCP